MTTDIKLRLAKYLLTLPEGGWPETQQAEGQLLDLLPSQTSLADIMELAARGNLAIHPSRRDWLRGLARDLCNT